MASNWRIYNVAELEKVGLLRVEDGNHGEYRPRPDEFTETGTAFIRAADMDSGRILFQSASRINETALARIRKGIGRPGDVLLSSKGTVGKFALAPLNCEPFVCSPQVTFWRSLDGDFLNYRFLYYYIQSSDFRRQVMARSSESDMAPYISLTNQRQFQIALPEIDEQKAIAHILGTLDDKIELNREMNQTLEAMARAIFKSWFVDFDPVRAKMEGRQPAGMDAATAELFPDEFEESGLGMIPKGWKISTIGESVKVVGGSTPSTKNPNYWDGGTIHWTTPKDLASLQSPVLLDTERKITEQGLKQISSGLLPKGTVLLSSRAPIGYLAISEVPVAINQGYIAMVCDGQLSNYYILHWVQQNIDIIKGRANGTTFLEISKSNFRPIQLIIPESKILQAFTLQVEALHQQIVNNLNQSHTLISIRDTLLPKLLSGEVRIKEAEKLVETVA